MKKPFCVLSPMKKVEHRKTAGVRATIAPSEALSSQPSPNEKMIPRFMAKLKMAPRGCLMQLSRRHELPSDLDKLINTLTSANIIALKMSQTQPAIERAARLENLLSHGLSLARRFHGVRASNDVYECVGRVKRLLTVSVRIARALVEAIEDTLSDSEDEEESDSEEEGESDSEDDSSDSESEDDSSESESETDKSEEESEAEDIAVPMPSSCAITMKNAQEQLNLPAPRRPEDCKTELSRNLSELLWKTREEVESKQKGVLSSTKKPSSQRFKSKGTKTQVNAGLLKCSRLSSANAFSALMGNGDDLVTLVKPAAKKVTFSPSVSIIKDQTNIPPVPCPKAKPIISERTEPSVSADELARTLDNLFDSVKYEFSKTMCEIVEQFSKSTVSLDAPTVVTLATTDHVPDYQHKRLTDGSVKFTLYASRLTKVIERKEKRQPLHFPKMTPNLCTGQVEENNKTSPIRESKLTSVLLNKDTVLFSAKTFGEKMQQAIQNQRIILTARRSKHSKTNVWTVPKKVKFHISVTTERDRGSSLGRKRSFSNGVDELPNQKAIKLHEQHHRNTLCIT